MGYEAKKVIEFGRENTKPVGVVKGALLLKDGKELVLQLKLRNNGKDILNRVTVKITCMGKDGQIKGVQNYTYERLFVECGEEFGSNVPIMLQYNDVEHAEIEIEDDYRNLKVSSKSVQRQQKNPYVLLVRLASIATLMAGIYSTFSMFNMWFATLGLTACSELILNSMYLYGIMQYILTASKIPSHRLYILNYIILVVNSICIAFLIVLQVVLRERSIYSLQIFYFINSIFMLVILSKYCKKKYLGLIILTVLIGLIPIYRNERYYAFF